MVVAIREREVRGQNRFVSESSGQRGGEEAVRATAIGHGQLTPSYPGHLLFLFCLVFPASPYSSGALKQQLFIEHLGE